MTLHYVFALALMLSASSAFVLNGKSLPIVMISRDSRLKELSMAQVALIPEPEGGQELIPNSSMDGTRMKLMGVADGLSSDEGTVYKFWMRAVAQGELVKKFKIDILKESKKKANFPGFRKGQVPPWAMPQIEGFAIQEGIIKTVEQAVKAYGLTSLPGSEGEVQVLEDVKEMCKGYKEGTSLEFTATLNCAMDPSRVLSPRNDASVIDAELEDATVEVEPEVEAKIEMAADEEDDA